MKHMLKSLACAVVAIAATLAFSTGAALAVPVVYSANLSGANENPPNASPGTGFAIVTLDADLNTLRVQVSFAGLSAPTSDAHIHCCTLPPNNVSVAVPGSGALPGFPLGVTSGSYDSTFDLLAATTYRPAFITANTNVAGARAALIAGIESGRAYVNVHTTAIPAGEIRGFLAPVSAPATIALFGAALAGLAATRRRAFA